MMSSASKSKSKDRKTAKETLKVSSKSLKHTNTGGGISTNVYNPLSGTFHTVDLASSSSGVPLQANGRFRNIDETDEHSCNSFETVAEYDSASNNGSWSGESEDHKEKTSLLSPRQDKIPSANNNKQEKIRQKNEKKHQRQKEKRAQDLCEKCCSYLMSRKLEALAQQLVAMGFPLERAMMALILNEGKVEESVAWLFEDGEEADNHKGHNLDGGDNLKIDISDELARIADMEISYKCSKQDVERALVASEGDFFKAEETLRSQKHEPLVPPKLEETGDPPTAGSSKLPVASIQNLIGAPSKLTSSTTTLQQKRVEKELNNSKVTTAASSSIDPGNKIAQSLKRVKPKLESTKTLQVALPVNKRLSGAGSNPSASYPLASSSSQPMKIEAQCLTVENELENLRLGSLRDHVTVIQRPQSIRAHQIPTPRVSSSSSSPLTTPSWYPNGVERKNPSLTSSSSSPGTPANWHPNGVERMNPSLSSSSSSPGTAASWHPNSVQRMNPSGTMNLNHQLHYQQQQPNLHQFVSNSGLVESPGINRGNNLLNATIPGHFSGLDANAPSHSLPSGDWNYSMPQFHYSNIDWRLDRGPSDSTVSGGGVGSTMNLFMHSNPRDYDSFTPGLGARAHMGGPSSFWDGVGAAETHVGVLHEWASPFEERDLFSLSRHFVPSPSL